MARSKWAFSILLTLCMVASSCGGYLCGRGVKNVAADLVKDGVRLGVIDQKDAIPIIDRLKD